MRDFGAIARQYAEDVVAGRVLACRFVQLAARRHLDDLAAQADDSFAYWFDEDQAHLVCTIVELFPHTKGKWARTSETLTMEPWQVFITASVFGWLRKDNGLRRFRVVYIEVPRKNGKSLWSSAIGLYMLAADNEEGAEVYSGATTEAQAKIVFEASKSMAKRTPDYRSAFGVEVMASNLSIPTNGSKFEAIIGKPGDGASPSCAIVDEYHEHKTDELYDTMWTGMGAREQPLMWTITTAGSNTAGPCYALHVSVVKMLEGTIPNDELFGIIYTVDEGDDWTSEEALRKANPNYDVSVTGAFLEGKVRDATQSSRKQNIVKTKHLNIWVGARTAWMNMEAWNAAADEDLDERQFEGEPCWIGVDLSNKVDIASVAKLFKREVDGKEHYYAFWRHYLPEAQIDLPEKPHYQGWALDGHLTATDGAVIDHEEITADVQEDVEAFSVVSVGYDPWGATQFAVKLQEHRVETLEIRQTTMMLSEPMKQLEALVLDGRFHHTGDPVATWGVSNVVAKLDANDNVFPNKEAADNKIDPAVAAIIALAVAQRLDGSASRSVYDERGIREL